MDFQLKSVQLTKEISWNEAQKRPDLYTDMMRNRIILHAEAKYDPVPIYENSSIMFVPFLKDTRKYLDSNNVGLYSFSISETFYENGSRIYIGENHRRRDSDQSKGYLVIYFEDAGDYARYLKDRAVNYKLSVY